MSHYVLNTDGCNVWEYTGDGHVLVTLDGKTVYDHSGTVTPPIPPANAILLPTPSPGAPASVTTIQSGQLYYCILSAPTGTIIPSKSGGSTDFTVDNALSQVADIGNWTKAAAMAVQKTTFPAGTVYPYYKKQSDESPGLHWVSVNTGNGQAVISPGWAYSFVLTATAPGTIYINLQSSL